MLVSAKKSALYLKSYFKQVGIQHIVLCPGSRNLPLIVSFSNDEFFKVYSLIDERVAGFFALGIAKVIKKPVAVVTTSGSAGINLAPAMAEAYYQRLPLIAITADRPPHFINKGENQTIIQKNLFGNFVGLEIEMEENIEFNIFEKKIQNINHYLFESGDSNNVHINMPFSEPLDKTENILGEFQFNLKPHWKKNSIASSLKLTIDKGQNVIIYVSTGAVNPILNQILDAGVRDKNWVVIAEIQSGWYNPMAISQIDLILTRNKDIQVPDILITIGESMLSKRFRNFIKEQENIRHIDISTYSRNWTNLSSDYQNIICDFLKLERILSFENQLNFRQSWLNAESQAIDYQNSYFKELEYQEFAILRNIIHSIHNESVIYWGNSSVVRYANWSNWKNLPNLTHMTNRGVSGIEGVLASAMGSQSIGNFNEFYCILGDISLLYEIGSLAATSFTNSIKIIVINNYGGKIFENIHDTEALGNTTALTTPHRQDFYKLSQIFDLEYFKSIDLESFLVEWGRVKQHSGKLIFEICMDVQEVGSWKDYFS